MNDIDKALEAALVREQQQAQRELIAALQETNRLLREAIDGAKAAAAAGSISGRLGSLLGALGKKT